MSEYNRYVLEVRIHDPERFRQIFGSAVVQLAYSDLTRGIGILCEALLRRYQCFSDVISPGFGQWHRVFGLKDSGMALDMREQLPVLQDIGVAKFRELLIGCFGQATGSRLDFSFLIIQAPENIDADSIHQAADQAFNSFSGSNQLEALGEEFGERAVRELLQAAGTRYILSHRSAEISEHLQLELGRGDATLAIKVTDDPECGYSRLVISTLDVAGLFSMIAGVLAANGINILGAQIYTCGNGAALGILHVNNPQGGLIESPAKWEKVRVELQGVVEGRIRVAELVARRQKSAGLLVQSAKPRYPDRVEFDADISRYTVIDIFTYDRVGLPSALRWRPPTFRVFRMVRAPRATRNSWTTSKASTRSARPARWSMPSRSGRAEALDI